MEVKKLSMSALLANKGVDISNQLGGLIVTEIAPNADGQKKVAMRAQTADGKITKEFEVGFKLLDEFAHENEAGETVINEGHEMTKIGDRWVAIKSGTNNSSSNFAWKK